MENELKDLEKKGRATQEVFNSQVKNLTIRVDTLNEELAKSNGEAQATKTELGKKIEICPTIKMMERQLEKYVLFSSHAALADRLTEECNTLEETIVNNKVFTKQNYVSNADLKKFEARLMGQIQETFVSEKNLTQILK